MEPENLPAKYQAADHGNPKSADLLKEIKKKAEPLALNASLKASDHAGKGNEAQVYAEDILVGYRYFDTMKQPVVFPFGFGLSYTTFQYSDGKITKAADGKTWTVSVKVKNTGKREGKETVQLYIGDDKASVMRPAKELKAFRKVSLKAGEEQEVTFTITESDLQFFDEITHQWKSEPGSFKAYIGSSSRDIKAKLAFRL